MVWRKSEQHRRPAVGNTGGSSGSNSAASGCSRVLRYADDTGPSGAFRQTDMIDGQPAEGFSRLYGASERALAGEC